MWGGKTNSCESTVDLGGRSIFFGESVKLLQFSSIYLRPSESAYSIYQFDCAEIGAISLLLYCSMINTYSIYINLYFLAGLCVCHLLLLSA